MEMVWLYNSTANSFQEQDRKKITIQGLLSPKGQMTVF